MRRLGLPVFFILSCLALALIYNSCSQSTKMYKREGASGVGNPMTVAATNVLASICGVVSRCQPEAQISECRAAILTLSGVDSQLGLPAGSYGSYSAIIEAEQAGLISGNTAATQACSSLISGLDCSDPSVVGAYDPSRTNAFSGAIQIIPTSAGTCPSVFTPPDRREYFVATDGSDLGDGSASQPWSTLTHAAQAVVLGPEGAVVHVAPGVYAPVAGAHGGIASGVFTAASGTSDSARIVYVSDRPWGAKIAPSGSFSAWYNLGDYVDIVGFEIVGDGSTYYGFQNGASYVRVIGNHIHDIPVQGCNSAGGGAGVIHGGYVEHDNVSEGNRIHNIGILQNDGLPGGSYCSGSGIVHNNPKGNLENNLIYNVAYFGILAWHAATDLNVTNNLIFGAGSKNDVNSVFGGGINIGAGDNGAGIQDNTTVSNNILRNNRGVAVRESGTTGPNNVYLNNLIFANGYDGIVLQTGQAPVGTVFADPLMVDFQSDGSGDYRLSPLSPAIDGGTTNCAAATGSGNCAPSRDYSGYARPYGTAVDIGPYEWHP